MAAAGGPITPVLIEMRALEKARTLDALLAQHFAAAGVEPIDIPALRYLIEEARMALLFDGFDELAFRVSYDRAVEHLDTLIEAASGRAAKVVVTSRSQHFLSEQQVKTALAERAERVPGYRLARLLPFSRAQIRRYLANRLWSEPAAGEFGWSVEAAGCRGNVGPDGRLLRGAGDPGCGHRVGPADAGGRGRRRDRRGQRAAGAAPPRRRGPERARPVGARSARAGSVGPRSRRGAARWGRSDGRTAGAGAAEGRVAARGAAGEGRSIRSGCRPCELRGGRFDPCSPARRGAARRPVRGRSVARNESDGR